MTKLLIDLRSFFVISLEKVIHDQSIYWHSTLTDPEDDRILINPIVMTYDTIFRILKYIFDTIQGITFDKIYICDRDSELKYKRTYYNERTKKHISEKAFYRQLIRITNKLMAYDFLIDNDFRKHLQFIRHKFSSKFKIDRTTIRKLAPDRSFRYSLKRFIELLVLYQTHLSNEIIELIYNYIRRVLFTCSIPMERIGDVISMDDCIVLSDSEFIKRRYFSNSIDIEGNSIENRYKFKLPNISLMITTPLFNSEYESRISAICEKSYGTILDINDDGVLITLNGNELKDKCFPVTELGTSIPETYVPKLDSILIEKVHSYGSPIEWILMD